MPFESEAIALPYSPARLASKGSRIVVADRRGALLFWSWPDEPPGPVIQAHGDGGPLAIVGDEFASSGGWDPSVALWDGVNSAPRYALKLFDGWVTALAGRKPFYRRWPAAGSDGSSWRFSTCVMEGRIARTTKPREGLG